MCGVTTGAAAGAVGEVTIGSVFRCRAAAMSVPGLLVIPAGAALLESVRSVGDEDTLVNSPTMGTQANTKQPADDV